MNNLLTSALAVTAFLLVGCNGDSVEEGSYDTWTQGLVTQQTGDNTLYFVPSADGNGMMLTFDRTDMSYERLVQMAGGSLSTTEGGTDIQGLHVYTGDVDIPESVNGKTVTSIDQYAFAGNVELTSVTIPSSINEIGTEAFAQCQSLTEITLPEGITEIKAGTFCGKSVTKITIPNSVTTIGHMAFLKNTQLAEIDIDADNSHLQSIGASAFSGCTAMTSFTMPVSVTTIGAYAFNGCTRLTALTVEANVNEMGDQCFKGCSRLKTIHMKSAVPPTVSGTTLSISSSAKVYIPTGSLEAYKNAEYWKTITKYVEE